MVKRPPNGAHDYRRLRTLRPSIARPLGLQIAHLAGQRIVLDPRRRRWRHHVNLRSVAVLNDDNDAGLRLLPGTAAGVSKRLRSQMLPRDPRPEQQQLLEVEDTVQSIQSFALPTGLETGSADPIPGLVIG
jgi:hypothetical protein